VDRLSVSFAALREPSFERRRQMRRRNAKARFKATLARGQRVVKLGVVRKIPHTEGIKPFEWAGLALTAHNDFDGQLLRVHATIIHAAARGTSAGLVIGVTASYTNRRHNPRVRLAMRRAVQ
jgi:hypothetical protein